jgi:hypothetical protein
MIGPRRVGLVVAGGLAAALAAALAARAAGAQVRVGVGAPLPIAPAAAPTAAPPSAAGPAVSAAAAMPPRGIRWVTPPAPGDRRPHRPQPGGHAAYPVYPGFWAYAPYYPVALYGSGVGAWYGALTEAGAWYGAPAEPVAAVRAVVVTPVVVPGVGAPVATVVERTVGRTKVIETGVGGRGADAGLAVGLVGDSLLRLTWAGDGRPVREVTLLTADAERRTIALQTVRNAPFTALVGASPAVAYVGVTIVYEGGTTTTSLVPYTPAGR